MAKKVIWSHEATFDLDAIADYISRDSAFYASAFVQGVLDTTKSLKEFSERGRVVPELCNPNIRELFVKEYRVIYSVEETCVVIIGLIHGKRDLDRLWKREKRG